MPTRNELPGAACQLRPAARARDLRDRTTREGPSDGRT
jgi:hypothetical protein